MSRKCEKQNIEGSRIGDAGSMVLAGMIGVINLLATMRV